MRTLTAFGLPVRTKGRSLDLDRVKDGKSPVGVSDSSAAARKSLPKILLNG